MGRTYSSLSIEERTQISLLRSQDVKPAEIARQLGRSKSTISRELGRNRTAVKPYVAAAAQQLAAHRRTAVKKGRRKAGPMLNSPLGRFVRSELRQALLPAQVAGRLKRRRRDDLSQRLWHETIYRDFINGGRNATAVGTAVERYSRLVLPTQMNGCTATHALEGFGRRFTTVIPELRLSLIDDRGSEIARHQALTDATDMPVYLCEPSVLTARAAVQG
jgi:IS30 family transposase